MKQYNLNVALNGRIVCTVLVEALDIETAIENAVEHADHEFGYNEDYNVLQLKPNKFRLDRKVWNC